MRKLKLNIECKHKHLWKIDNLKRGFVKKTVVQWKFSIFSSKKKQKNDDGKRDYFKKHIFISVERIEKWYF